MIRVVLDTNVIISFTLSPSGVAPSIYDLFDKKSFELLVSESILDEYKRALFYPSIKKRRYISDEEALILISRFEKSGILVKPLDKITASTDVDDNKFLECAVMGSADYIVSRDKHLLDLHPFQGIPIYTPSRALPVLEEGAK